MLRLISGTDTIGDIGKKNNEKVDNPSLADITALKVGAGKKIIDLPAENIVIR